MSISTLGSLPKRMSARNAEMHEYPDHASVLAVLSAYQEATREAMPWSLLVIVIEELQTEDSELKFVTEGVALLDASVRQIVADLRALGLVSLGSDGTRVTAAGEAACAAWNGMFRQRKEYARQELEQHGFLSPSANG